MVGDDADRVVAAVSAMAAQTTVDRWASTVVCSWCSASAVVMPSAPYLAEHGSHCPRGPLPSLGQEVAVGVGGGLNVLVPEDSRHLEQRHPLGEQQGGCGVPQVVRPPRRTPRPG